MGIQDKTVTYVRESLAEMKRVVWPSRKQTIQHTVIVIVFSLTIAIFLGALDFLFQKGMQQLINRF